MVPHRVPIHRGWCRHRASAWDGAWLLKSGNNSSVLILPRKMKKKINLIREITTEALILSADVLSPVFGCPQGQYTLCIHMDTHITVRTARGRGLLWFLRISTRRSERSKRLIQNYLWLAQGYRTDSPPLLESHGCLGGRRDVRKVSHFPPVLQLLHWKT